MNEQFTKGEVDRLGNKIRLQNNSIDEATLDELQLYRTSHNDSLSKTFSILCAISKKVDSASIITFRIKRFQSIIGKLNRYNDMRFSRMWDIAGCRCILKREEDLYKIKKLLRRNKEITILKEYDYLKSPKDDGYRSLHLFVKHNCSDITIEIQLRTLINHNWATLVEITDFLFDSKLKEYGENKQLQRFHFLLAEIDQLSTKEKFEIAKTIKDYNYWQELSNVFSRNYLQVRKRWLELEHKYNHKYFLIETTKGEPPKIDSFSNALNAENEYFNIYKLRPNANVVLTYLQKPSYSQISIAYSNYILTFHNFLSEFLQIFESLIVESLVKKRYYAFYKQLDQYHDFVISHIHNLLTEIRDAEKLVESSEAKTHRIKSKENEWITDIYRQINFNNERSQKLSKSISLAIPKGPLNIIIVRLIIKKLNKRYKSKLDRKMQITETIVPEGR